MKLMGSGELCANHPKRINVGTNANATTARPRVIVHSGKRSEDSKRDTTIFTHSAIRTMASPATIAGIRCVRNSAAIPQATASALFFVNALAWRM